MSQETGAAKLSSGCNYGSKATGQAWEETGFMKDVESRLTNSGLSAGDQVVLSEVIGGHMPSTGVDSLSVYSSINSSSQAWGAESFK